MIEKISDTKTITSENERSEQEPRSEIEVSKREYGDINYTEYLNHPSFSEAVDFIKEVEPFKPSLSAEERGNGNFVLVDIDGTLIPSIRLVRKPKPIDTKTSFSFTELVNMFGGSVAIATNRNEGTTLFPNSSAVVQEARNLIKKTRKKDIPIYTGLFKQMPLQSKENVAKEFGESKVMLPKIDSLIHHIGKRISESNNEKITLYSIEDKSFVSPNREDCLVYIAKRLKEEYDIEVTDIINLVINKRKSV